ncbi:hypothetical protein I4U23_005062 [Adineta vaga]|nr:hypothetical protein I4U23_005062 [Adineta vaga]
MIFVGVIIFLLINSSMTINGDEYEDDDYTENRISFSELSSMISNVKIENDQCEFQLTREIFDYCQNQMLISELTEFKTILYIKMIYYDQNDDVIVDDDGNSLESTSNIHDFGHMLNLFDQEFPFFYVKCLLYLQPNSNFNLQNLFFHFPSSSTTTTIGTINGPTIFSIDFNVQTYIVSIKCPFKCTCMWLFDGHVICPRSDTRVNLTFDQTLIGNRTLSYVKYISNKPIILASLLISILPKTIPAPTCNDSIRNQDETAVDCGGSTCKKCDLNQICQVNRDCSNGYCPSTTKIFINPCSNGIYWNVTGITYAGTGGSGIELNQLNNPYGIAFDSNNNLFITEEGNARVVKYSPGASNGTLVAGQTNVSGSNLNQFSDYLALLYVDSNQTLYIVDNGNYRVIRWERNASNGTIVAGNGTSGSTLEQLSYPYGIWVDSYSNVFVSDPGNHRVTKWSPGATQGVLVAGAADYTPGSAPDHLNEPWGLVYDESNQDLYIVNSKSQTVMKWKSGDRNGTVVANITGSPWGITLDPWNNLYVTIPYNGNIELFCQGNSTGIIIAGVNNGGTALNKPSDVKLDSQLNLYVAEYGGHKVTRFNKL